MVLGLPVTAFCKKCYAKWYNLGVLRAEMKCLCLFLPHTYNLVCKISSVNAHSANLGHSDLVLGLPVTLPVPILCQKYYAKWYKLGVLRADMKCLCLFLPHTCNLVCKIWSANTYLTNLEHSALVLPLPVTLPVPTLCKNIMLNDTTWVFCVQKWSAYTFCNQTYTIWYVKFQMHTRIQQIWNSQPWSYIYQWHFRLIFY